MKRFAFYLPALAAAVLALSWMRFTEPRSVLKIAWNTPETTPLKAARPFHGFLPDGSFIMAGGSDFIDGKKVYLKDIAMRSRNGEWSKIGELPYAVAEGVTCETPLGVFCAGGTDGTKRFDKAFLLKTDGASPCIVDLPSLPEPLAMGAAAADGTVVYVVGEMKTWKMDVSSGKSWSEVFSRSAVRVLQPVAAVVDCAERGKSLVVYGGFNPDTLQPLREGYALSLSSGKSERISDLPENTTTIGAAFLPCGRGRALLIGGFGWEGWIARAINGSKETDPVKLGWQRRMYVYDGVADAWRICGSLGEGVSPRCGAAAGIFPAAASGEAVLLVAAGEIAPAKRTSAVDTGTIGE